MPVFCIHPLSGDAPHLSLQVSQPPSSHGGQDMHRRQQQQQQRRQQLRSVGWLAPSVSSEALPGRGLKCWLAVPAARMCGLSPDILAGIRGCGEGSMPLGAVPAADALHPAPADAALPSGAGFCSPSSHSSGTAAPSATVEMRLAIGNRRLMAEEGVAVGTQASHKRYCCYCAVLCCAPLCSDVLLRVCSSHDSTAWCVLSTSGLCLSV
jgi:hypothetical protein